MKYLQVIIVSLLSVSASAQTLTREHLDNAKNSRGSFEKYILDESTTYTLGDTIQIGMPSSEDHKYQYIKLFDKDRSSRFLPEANSFKIVIKSIKINKTKGYGYQCMLETSFSGATSGMVLLDQAVASGEVQKNILQKSSPVDILNTTPTASTTVTTVTALPGDKTMLLHSGLSLQKSKNFKITALLLGITGAGVYALSVDQNGQTSDGLLALGAGAGLASAIFSIGSIHHLGRSGSYLQAYANGFIITF